MLALSCFKAYPRVSQREQNLEFGWSHFFVHLDIGWFPVLHMGQGLEELVFNTLEVFPVLDKRQLSCSLENVTKSSMSSFSTF